MPRPDTIPASSCITVTIGFLAGTNRYQVVLHFGSETPIGNVLHPGQDMQYWLINTFFPVWTALFNTSTQIVGMSVEAMAGEGAIPTRFVFPNGTYQGDDSADSLPPQTSLLFVYYSDAQMALPNKRTAVAKTFMGPMSESFQEGGKISDASLDTIAPLLNATFAPIAGHSSTVNWYRMMSASATPGDLLYTVAYGLTRRELFTQKRRMLPLY